MTGHAGPLSFDQTGRPLSMIGLCFKILLLSIVTLTLYRFWGRTEVRRYLWGHTVIDGEPLDYLGKGSELFIGFMIALVFYLTPLGVALQALFIYFPPTDKGAPSPLAMAGFFVAYVSFFYLIAVGLYQALRYRLSRTSWRGVRFALKGSAFGFGLKFLLLGFANLLCAGLITPIMDLSLFRTIAKHTYFGDKPFDFDGKAKSLYGPFLITYVLVLVIYLGFAAAAMILMRRSGPINPDMGPEQMITLLPYFYAGAIVVALLMMIATSVYAANSLRIKGSGLRFEGLSFTLEAQTFSYLWLTISNLVIVTISAGLLLPVAELRRFQYIFRRLSSSGTVDLNSIGQSTGPRPHFGEGLAEAFGMGNV